MSYKIAAAVRLVFSTCLSFCLTLAPEASAGKKAIPALSAKDEVEVITHHSNRNKVPSLVKDLHRDAIALVGGVEKNKVLVNDLLTSLKFQVDLGEGLSSAFNVLENDAQKGGLEAWHELHYMRPYKPNPLAGVVKYTADEQSRRSKTTASIIHEVIIPGAEYMTVLFPGANKLIHKFTSNTPAVLYDPRTRPTEAELKKGSLKRFVEQTFTLDKGKIAYEEVRYVPASRWHALAHDEKVKTGNVSTHDVFSNLIGEAIEGGYLLELDSLNLVKVLAANVTQGRSLQLTPGTNQLFFETKKDRFMFERRGHLARIEHHTGSATAQD